MELLFNILIIISIVGICIVILSSYFTKQNGKIQFPIHKQVSEQDRNLLETVTKSDRGTYAERFLVLKLLQHGIPAKTIFHDLYVKKPNEDYSQIDLVVATTAGIVVFEVKDYSGWIFGKGNQPQWTQVLAHGKQKYRFYNPILQNNKHIAELRKKLRQFEKVPFYSVVVFDGDCEFRDISFIPEGTFVVRMERVLEVMRIIQAKEPAPFTDKHEVIRVFKEAVENGAHKGIEQNHANKIKDMLGKHRVFD